MKDETQQPRARSRKGDRSSERGFSILEVIVGFIILTVVGLSTVSLTARSINNSSGASDRTAALAIAQQRMERLRSIVFSDLTATAADPTPETVTSGGRSYGVVTRIVDVSATQKRITVEVTPQSGSDEWSRTPVIVTGMRSRDNVVGPLFGEGGVGVAPGPCRDNDAGGDSGDSGDSNGDSAADSNDSGDSGGGSNDSGSGGGDSGDSGADSSDSSGDCGDSNGDSGGDSGSSN